jgi:GT2 family glycosyltransferase
VSGAVERVAVAVVSHESAADLPGCLAAAAALDHRPLELVVVDCASADGSAAVARRQAAALGLAATVVALEDNRGFAGGMNAALAAGDAPFVLSLNPDARPAADYLTRLLARLRERPAAGAATGRLVRWAAAGEPPRLDACGMRLTLSWRHLDRGSGEVDGGQLARPERVFGATGAATLFRRAALDDVAVGGEVFDAGFHSFREDAELAFRLAERGWEVLYEPAARALHRRRVLPGRRRRLPPAVNYHSLKNRYLLRCYHQTAGNLLLTALPALARDLGALVYVLLRERSSLAAYGWLWRRRREILRRRRAIQRRRTRPPHEVDRWFFRRGLPL